MNDLFKRYLPQIFLFPLLFLFVFTIFVFIRDDSVDARIETHIDLTENSMYGGAHAPLNWFSLGGGATTTENILVTSTPYFSGKFPTSEAVVNKNGDIFLVWSDPLASDTGWRISGSKFDAETNRWSGFGADSDKASSVFFTSTTALSTSVGLAPAIDENGLFAVAWIDAVTALRDAYFARWDADASAWKSLSNENRFDGPLVTSANQLLTPNLINDEVGNLFFSYFESIGGKRRLKLGKIVGSNLEGPVNGAAGPDEPMILAGFTTNDSFLYSDFALDVIGKPYVIAQLDTPASSLDPIYTTRFDGTQWSKWGSDAAGYDTVFDQTPYGMIFYSANALKRVGSKIYASFAPKFSSSDISSVYFPYFDITSQSWKSPSGNYSGATSTESRVVPPSSSAVNAFGVDATADGVVYGVGRNFTDAELHIARWDVSAQAWSGVVAASVSEDLLSMFNLSQANYTAMTQTVFTDPNGLPMYVFRAKDPANSSNDAIFGVRALHTTSTPTVIDLGEVLSQDNEQQRAYITCDCDLNGGTVDFQISVDGENWFGKSSDDVYVFPSPSGHVYAQAIITPEASGGRSPVVRGVDFGFEPAGKRAFVQGTLPQKPVVDSVYVVSSTSVTYNFHQGSNDTTGYRVVSINSDDTQSEITQIEQLLDSGITDQSDLTVLSEDGLLPGKTYCNRALVGFNGNGDSEPTPIPCFTMTSSDSEDVNTKDEKEGVVENSDNSTSTTLPKTEEQEKTKNPFNQFISDYNFWEGVQLVRVRGTSDVYILSEGVAYKIDKLTRTALGFIEEYIHPISVEEFKKYPISPEGWNSYKVHPQWTRIFVRERSGLFVLFDNILYPIEKLYEREVLSDQGIAVISERLFPYIFAK